ncbi:D-aminoacyl-tRNA deacylase [Candidatus Dependentiae bacterium]
MRAIIQRVTSASVSVDDTLVSQIGVGLLVLLGIKDDDTQKDQEYIAKKMLNLRIFSDEQGKMNKSIQDISGELLLVSQFTLYGDCRKGNRPSFVKAMPPQKAEVFYNAFVEHVRKIYPRVKEGAFGAYMQVTLVNDGPVTILIDSQKP